MGRLRLEPTEIAQWQLLVREAEQAAGCYLMGDIEHYLITLLDRFCHQPEEIAFSIVAEAYLESLQEVGNLRQMRLRDVGDKCLIFSGLFPAQADKHRVAVSYYVELGQQAYHLISINNLKQPETAKLFRELKKQFVMLMDTLQCMRELAGTDQALSLLQAEELWQKVHSAHALKTLQRCVNKEFLVADNLTIRNLQ